MKLDQSPRVIQIRNHISRLEAELHRLRKSKRKRDSQEHRRIAPMLFRPRRILEKVTRLAAKASNLEIEFLQQVYQSGDIERSLWSTQIEQCEAELRDTLIELAAFGKVENQVITLAMLTLDLSLIQPLLQAYLEKGADHNLEVKGYWLAPVDSLQRSTSMLLGGRSVPDDGVPVKRRRNSQKNVAGMNSLEPTEDKEAIGVFAILDDREYQIPPKSAVGLLLQIQGFAAALRFEQEAGLHIFRPANAEGNQLDQSCLVETLPLPVTSANSNPRALRDVFTTAVATACAILISI
jgi:hypothetical protein